MDELNLTLPPELESALSGFYSTPGPDAAFAARLELELRRRQALLREPGSKPFFRWRTPANTFWQSMRARPALLILFVILALSLLTGVAYAIGRLAGFIPGYGFTADAGIVFTLKQPAQAGKDGVTISVDHAISDQDKFWVAVTQSGKIDTQHDNPPGAFLRLLDGTKIAYRQAGAMDTGTDPQKMSFEFPALPAGADALTFHYEILGSDGKGLWMVEIPLQLRPIRADELIPAQPAQATSRQSETHDGLTLVLENVAAASNKTVLQVALRFDQAGGALNSAWGVTLTGADGKIYPLTEITSETPENNKKLYETLAFPGGEALTLRLAVFPDSINLPMSVDFSPNAPAFTFDPGPNPQVGQTWPLDETMQAGNYSLHVVGAKMTTPNQLLFEFAPTPGVTAVMLYSTLASGAAGDAPVDNQKYTSTLMFEKMPTQPFKVSVTRVGYTAHGPWQIDWQAPAAPAGVMVGATRTPLPTAFAAATATLALRDSLLFEVQTLAQKFDAPFQRGPGWIHFLKETETHPRTGQTFPPPYITNEQWLEIDADGYILRSVYTDRDKAGNILQQVVTVGNYYTNLLTGDAGHNDGGRNRFSTDMLSRDLSQVAQYNTQVVRDEVPCDDGSACLLISMLDSFANPVTNPGEAQAFSGGGRRTWINLQSGQQVKIQYFWGFQDGSEQVDYTYRPIAVEKVNAPPQEILDILAKVVVP